jgi:hypothetical protein
MKCKRQSIFGKKIKNGSEIRTSILKRRKSSKSNGWLKI